MHVKWPSYELLTEVVKRCCAGCAKVHAGVADANSKVYEGRNMKKPSYELPAERKQRWYARCTKAHAGAMDVVSKTCEGCNVKQASYELSAKLKKHWSVRCRWVREGTHGAERVHTRAGRRARVDIPDAAKCNASWEVQLVKPNGYMCIQGGCTAPIR
jgi:hypothetical protein